MGEVKYLGNGEAAIVLGHGQARATSLDGGRTVEEVDTVAILRVPHAQIEYVEAEQLLDERPELDPETNLPVPSEEDLISGPQVAAQSPAPQRNAEQLQAEIDERQRELSQLRGEEPGNRTHQAAPQHERSEAERAAAAHEGREPRPPSTPPQAFSGPTPPAGR